MLQWYLALYFKKEKTTHFWILKKSSRTFQHTFVDFEFFLKNFKTRTFHAYNIYYMFLCQHTFWDLHFVFMKIFKTRTFHTYNNI